MVLICLCHARHQHTLTPNATECPDVSGPEPTEGKGQTVMCHNSVVSYTELAPKHGARATLSQADELFFYTNIVWKIAEMQ